MKKQIFVLLLTALLLSSVASCSKPAETETENTATIAAEETTPDTVVTEPTDPDVPEKGL